MTHLLLVNILYCPRIREACKQFIFLYSEKYNAVNELLMYVSANVSDNDMTYDIITSAHLFMYIQQERYYTVCKNINDIVLIVESRQ